MLWVWVQLRLSWEFDPSWFAILKNSIVIFLSKNIFYIFSKTLWIFLCLKISHGFWTKLRFRRIFQKSQTFTWIRNFSYCICCCRGSASPKSYTSHSSLEDKFPSNIRMAPIPECIKWNGGSRASVARNQSECSSTRHCLDLVFIIEFCVAWKPHRCLL